MYKFYSFIFYAGIATSLYSGIGLKFGLLEETVAGLYGILGLVGTGLGFAGRNYIYKKQELEKQIKAKKGKKVSSQ
ncbi:MAG: hypothetical protein AVO33_06825 [delta proteobacterium ML8_F1]|nr:MAG: hypothetical protein AVO33_06825 [delta proteobacterium ML8_F1]